jgi:transposase
MRLHRNAKTTPKMRQLLIDRVTRQGWTQAAAARAAGVSVRTVAKWIGRARGGDAALEAGSSRPHHQPRRLDVARTAAIVAARQARATASEISARVGVPRSTVARVLARAGLNRLRALDAPPVIQRYEWAQAGDLLHLDIKPLMRIRGIGHQIHGDRRRQARGVGREYVRVAIDDATRTVTSTTPDTTPPTMVSVGFSPSNLGFPSRGSDDLQSLWIGSPASFVSLAKRSVDDSQPERPRSSAGTADPRPS